MSQTYVLQFALVCSIQLLRPLTPGKDCLGMGGMLNLCPLKVKSFLICTFRTWTDLPSLRAEKSTTMCGKSLDRSYRHLGQFTRYRS